MAAISMKESGPSVSLSRCKRTNNPLDINIVNLIPQVALPGSRPSTRSMPTLSGKLNVKDIQKQKPGSQQELEVLRDAHAQAYTTTNIQEQEEEEQ